MLEAFLFLAGGLALLVLGAEALVRGSSALALRLGMSPLLIGLTVVAFGTSGPELVASLRAALAGSTDMALGNVIGSNISNIALVLGLGAVIRPILVPLQIVRVDARIALVASLVLVVMLFDGEVGRIEGAALFAALIAYIWMSVRQTRTGPGPQSAADSDFPDATTELSLWAGLGLTLVGLVGLAGGAELFVHGARDLALLFGVSEAVIGLTVMAVGTSLPEIATVVAASLKGMNDLITGNAIGSNIFNVLCVVGLSALVIPLSVGDLTHFDLVVFIAMAVAILLTMRTNLRLSRTEGLILIGFHFLYVGSLFLT